MDDPRVAYPVFEKAQELGVNLIGVHKGVPLGPQPIEHTRTFDMDGAAANFPDLNFVIFHVGLPWLDEVLWQIVRYPNLYASIAATVNFISRQPRVFAETLGKMLWWCGEDKILYGGEAPIWHPQWALEAFWDFELPEDIVERARLPAADRPGQAQDPRRQPRAPARDRPRREAEGAAGLRLDHVIYATADLDAAAARVEAELGLAVAAGGRHEGMGTHNRIVPLGGGYLELLAVADAAEAAGSPLGAAVARRIDTVGEGLLGYAVSVEDVPATAARLGVAVSTITRSGFTGTLAGVAEAMTEPCLPFFVHRARGVADPGAGAPAGGIAWLEVAGDAARLERWLDGAELPVRVVPGEPAVRALGVGADRVIHADGTMRLR